MTILSVPLLGTVLAKRPDRLSPLGAEMITRIREPAR